MIEIDHLTVHCTDFALRDVNFKVEQGEFFALLGPTGAGKTLILESIAGLVKPDQGSIRIDGRDVTNLPPEKRGVGIVYQDHALFPHLNVRQNITYGLRYHLQANAHKKESFDDLAAHLGLTPLLDRTVGKLSGGEKQRVALARALAIDPMVLLLDEPLSSLDPNFREEIRQLLKELHRRTAITVLMVTHDFSEAHYLARRVAVINGGCIEQIGDVPGVFCKPANMFVAEFLGMKNIFPATFSRGRARVGAIDLKIMGHDNGHSRLAIRPEHMCISVFPPVPPPPNHLEGTVTQINNQGVYADISVNVRGVQFQSILTASGLYEMKLTAGQRVFLSVAPENIHLI